MINIEAPTGVKITMVNKDGEVVEIPLIPKIDSDLFAKFIRKVDGTKTTDKETCNS